MIGYVLLSLWALFIIVCLVEIAKKIVWKRRIFEFQEFDNVDIPFVTINIQGNLMNMIVDTGCGVSMLSESAIKDCELLYRNSDRKVSLSAVTNESVEMNAKKISFNIGKKEVTEDFFIHSADDFGNFRAQYGIECHGLLGSSFFNNYNCKIDYKKHTLTV